MKLTLKIENFDYLPDGGPLEFSTTARGCEIGRDSAMDWTLPDPARHISSRHFEISYRDRQFWLSDISTNGTFVYGQSMRVSSPFLLTHNDRLQVGHYIIRVLITDPAQAVAPQAFGMFNPPQAPVQANRQSHVQAPVHTPAHAAADPWSLTPTPTPMPTPMPSPQRPSAALAGQFGDSFVESPRAAPAPAPTPPPAARPAPPAVAVPQSEPFAARPAAPAAAPSASSQPAISGSEAAGLLDAICSGAGLPPGSLAHADLNRTGEEIGRCLRIATEELMALLGARAAAKQFVKSASRTMIGGLNNSPLKFKPNAVEALTTMFVTRPESYLSSTVTFQQGFDDIKRHQTAVYAAMQPALAKLLEDLSPESIEEKTTGGLMSSKKTRAWETYVERWDAKTRPHENGMLDVYLAFFADAYDVAVKKTGG